MILRLARIPPAILILIFPGLFLATAAPLWVTAYYPVWSLGTTNGGSSNPMYPHQVKWLGVTHVIHFGVGPDQTPPYWHPDATNNFGGPSNDSLNMFYGVDWRGNTSYRMVDSLRKYAHAAGAKLLLSSGGIWGAQAAAMNYITSDSSRTQVFVDAVVAFAGRHGYDGVEIDYEPPQSRTAMSLLTRIMKRKITTVLGPSAPLVMTVANLAENDYSIDLKDSVAQYLLMMYDMHNPYNGIGSPGGAYDVTGFNAPLHLPDAVQYPTLGTASLNYDGRRPVSPSQFWGPNKMASMGFPRTKIGVGIPFYGYVFDTKSAPDQSASGVYAHYLSYTDAQAFLSRGGTYHWEGTALVPWAGGTATGSIGWVITAGHQTYVTFDDTNSVKEKVRWASTNGFGGMMVYELWTGWVNSAPPGRKQPLLDALISEVRNVSPPDTTPPPPVLSSPASGSTIVTTTTSTTIRFDWSNVVTASSYRFQLAADQSFANVIAASTASANSLTESLVLTPGQTYYWRVASVNLWGQSAFASAANFLMRFGSDVVYVPVLHDWNMVSLPVTRQQRRWTEVFPNAISPLYTYIDPTGLNQCDSLAYGMGYWLKFPASSNVPVTGLLRNSDSVMVHAGWNIVGALSHPLPVSTIVQYPPGLLLSAFIGGPPYQHADTLIPGRGYWIRAGATGYLLYPASSRDRP